MKLTKNMHNNYFLSKKNWGIPFVFLLLVGSYLHAENPAKDNLNPTVKERSFIGPMPQQGNRTITGTVVDEMGEPVIGANVSIKGTTTGAVTDIDGKFSLSVPADAILKITYIGYTETEMKVGNQKILNITMKEDTQKLNEVVVVGFGSQKKVNVTGAVSTVNAEVLESRPVANVSQALQGVVPGLNLTLSNRGGEMNQAMNISIRGAGTIGDGSNSSPLILIDGMEGDMNAINPNDIETISVLKDAAASSIYGSRAPFGVILITTKSGKAGRTSVSYSTNLRFKSPLSMPEMMDSKTFANYFNDAGLNNGDGVVFSEELMGYIDQYQKGQLTDATRWGGNSWGEYMGSWANTDWFKEQYGNAFSQEHNLSVNGGNEKVTYMISGSFMDDNGLARHGEDNFQRYNLSGKINATLSKYAKVMYNTKFIRENYDRPSYMTPLFYHNIARRWPTCPVYDPNGYYMEGSEIIQLEDGGRDVNEKDQIYQQLQIILEPIKDWQIHAEGSMKIENQYNHWDVLPVYRHGENGEPIAIAQGSYTPGQSRVSESTYKKNQYTLNLYTDYFKDFEGGHYLKAMLGFNAELYKERWLSGTRDKLITPSVPTLNTATSNQRNGGGYDHWSTAGFFGRVNYNYKERYLVEANLRYDGTSRFIGDKRWGWFPSFSAGWNIAREGFWQDYENIVNTFKFRASWGELGNCNTKAFYPFYQTMPITMEGTNWLLNGVKQNIASAPGMVSSEMTWETVRSWDIGLDFGLLNNRLTGSFDYFVRKTIDMIGPAPKLPVILGTGVPKINNADQKAWGFELEVNWRDRIDDFSYGVKFVLSDDQRKVTRYPNDNLDRNQWYAGKMDGIIWGYETIGIAKTQKEMDDHLATLPNGGQSGIPGGTEWGAGDIMYRDLNGDGKIDAGGSTLNNMGDITEIGNTTPRFKFGLTLDAAWKGFDVSVFLQGVAKRDYVLWGPYFWGANADMWQSAGFKQHLDYFRPEGTESPFGPNTDAYYPKVYFGKGGKNTQTQSRFMQNASYIRLKNVQIGYTLPKSITQKILLNNVRIYVSGENLLTGTKLSKIYDPEVIDKTDWDTPGKAYPLSRIFSVGLNVNF